MAVAEASLTGLKTSIALSGFKGSTTVLALLPWLHSLSSRFQERVANMVGTRKATKRDVVGAVLFVVLMLVLLSLILFFPKSRILQTINTEGIAVLLLAVFAACTSGLITWIVFRNRTTGRGLVAGDV